MHSTTLGIAVTTFNRRDMLLAQVEALRNLTSCDFDLVICDDGSSDGTVEAAKARGFAVIGGTNRGIAWNKNRGLFYLREIIGSQIILLLDDDVIPNQPGWEQLWMEGVERWGHINFLGAKHLTIRGASTPDDPGLSHVLWGACVAFSRAALSYVGYMDTRFKNYGHEHTDLTTRAIRAGFGGFMLADGEREKPCFYSLTGGLTLLGSDSYADAESIAQNGRILELSAAEQIYRNPWRDAEEYEVLRSEIAALDGLNARPPYKHKFHAETLQHHSAQHLKNESAEQMNAPTPNLARGKPAMQSSFSEWSRGKTIEEDAGGAVNGHADGKRKFHTNLETNPWWQVDLGLATTIAEIRIFNTIEPQMRDRFKNFKISIAFDPDSWVDVFQKDDDAPVGGIDGHPYTWKPDLSAWGRLVRITMLGTGFLHLDQVEIFAKPAPNRNPNPNLNEPRAQSGHATGSKIPDAELFAKFNSLGDNCEFGIVQRNAGLEVLDLFRFGGTGKDETGLIVAINERFAAFGSAADLLVTDDGGGEWIARSRRYQITFHTRRKPAEVSHATVFADESQKMQFLARKMVEDLEGATKIFVRKSNKPVTDETMFKLHNAMQPYGNPVLLWVTRSDADHPPATVEYIIPGLYKGFIRSLAPYEGANNGNLADWRDLCSAALNAVQQTETKGSDLQPVKNQ